MTQIKALYLSTLVIRRPNHLRVNVQRRHRHQTDVKLQCHRQECPHVALEIVLMMSVPAQVLGVVPHSFPKLFGMVYLLRAEAN